MLVSKKTLVAVAVAGAFALPIAAQAQSSISISGKIYPQIVNVETSGATAKGASVSTMGAAAAGTADSSTLSMDSPNSRLSFRGTEDLGKGMKAFFQLEMGFGIDTGANSSTTALFSRDSFVGVSGGFGRVRLGKMDTVYKSLGDTLSFLGVSSGNFMSISNVLSKPGFGTSSASSFHLRRDNSIIYETPVIAGFQGLFDYSLGEEPGNTSTKSVVSTGVKYTGGPVYLAVAYETHKNLFGASKNVSTDISNVDSKGNPLAGATSNDTALRFTAQYKLTKDTRIEGNIAKTEYDETGGAAGKFANYKHNVWSVAAEHKMDAITLVGSYANGAAGSCTLVGTKPCSTAGLEGNMFNLGVGYNLSKRTMLYGVYSKITNGSSAVYNNIGNGTGRATTGQDIGTLAAGVSHTF